MFIALKGRNLRSGRCQALPVEDLDHGSLKTACDHVHLNRQNLGWAESELRKRAKGYPAKIGLAWILRQETTMTLGWIAQALHMGTRTYLSHLLYWQGNQKKPKQG